MTPIVQNTLKNVQVLNRLGGGNFGEVYRGEWKVEKNNYNGKI